MKGLSIGVCLLAFVSAGCVSVQGPITVDTGDADAGVLRHVVLFKFKDGTTPEQIQAIEGGFQELPGKIDAIVDFEWGTDVGERDMAQGYTHCFVVTFPDAGGLEEYLPHPAHQEYVQVLRPHLDQVLVVDYHMRR